MTFISLLAPLVLTAVAQEPAPDVTTLRFGWPAEGSVRVREDILKKGRSVETTYVLRWAPIADGSGTVLEYSDYEIVSFGGVPRSDPRLAKVLPQFEALASAMPKFTLDEEGNLTGFIGFEEMIDSVLGLLEERDPELGPKIAELLRQPQMRATMEEKAAETWNAWVGNWIDLEVERGTEEVWEVDVEEYGGFVREFEYRFGERAEYRGLECVEIAMESVADEALLLRTTLEMLGLIAESVDVELPDELPFARMARTDLIEGIFAVDGLRPLEVERSMTVQIWKTANSESEESLESHHYVFEWSDMAPADEDDDGDR